VAGPSTAVRVEFVAWNEALLDVHARTKFSAFRAEIDAVVFPCLGRLEGCRRLMREIRRKPGFLPEATWLVARRLPARGQAAARFTPLEWCGTIQGVIDRAGLGSIQNVGILPAARGLGLGSSLIGEALAGFRDAGVRRATLEVTAENTAAIRLYHRLGFRRTKTLYKNVEQVRREQQRQQPTVERLPLGVPSSQLKTAASGATAATDRTKRSVVSTMVSALVSGLVVAEEASAVADSTAVGEELAAVPAGHEPLATSRTS
jgi:GNAT superfamily N-acetyltransferase